MARIVTNVGRLLTAFDGDKVLNSSRGTLAERVRYTYNDPSRDRINLERDMTGAMWQVYEQRSGKPKSR